MFFREQSTDSLIEAILAFEEHQSQFSPEAIRDHSLQFDTEVFKSKIREFVDLALLDFTRRAAARDFSMTPHGASD